MAAQRTLATGESPYVVIDAIDGDASISGWGRTEVAITAHPERIDALQTPEGVRISLRDDASIQIPVGSRLLIRRVDGDLSLSSIAGPVALQDVTGDASINDVGSLTIDNAGEDLSVRNVRGDCTLGRVRGDASVLHISGNLVVERVEEDLSISDVRGSVRAVGGEDVDLRLKLLPGCSYDVRADDDLRCRIPAASSVRVSLSAGDSLRVARLESPPVSGNSASFQLGAGEATLSLVAGDDLELNGIPGEDFVDFSFDFGPEFGARFADFAQQLAGVIEEQVGSVARSLDEKLNSMGGSEEVASRIQEKVLAAARAIEEKITEAMRASEARTREAEKRAGEAERTRGRGHGGWGGPSWAPPAPPAPKSSRPAAPPVSEEERLAVLRMVSEGKISVEQAERLLAALNGRTGGDD